MIYVDDHRMGATVSAAAGYVYNPACDHSICRTSRDDDRVLGGVVFEAYNGRSLMMHCAGFEHGWMNRNLLGMSFYYPFVQLGCIKVFLQVSTGNEKARKFATNLGFRQCAVLKDAFSDGDCVVLEMYRADCRWLGLPVKLNVMSATMRNANGKEVHATGAAEL